MLAKRQMHVTRNSSSPLSECKGISFIFQRCERKMKKELKLTEVLQVVKVWVEGPKAHSPWRALKKSLHGLGVSALSERVGLLAKVQKLRIRFRISADLRNHSVPEHEAGRRWLEQYRS